MYVLLKVILEFNAWKITLQMSMRYYEIIKRKKISIQKEYNQYIKYTIARTIQMTNI